MRAALRRVIDNHATIDLVAEAASGEEVLPVVTAAAPDVVLLDLVMPRVDGLAALEELQRRFPELPVVILSAFARPEDVRRAAAAGARGYALKTVSSDVLLGLVEEVALSGPGDFTTRGLEQAPTGEPDRLLTKRERSVLSLIGRGLSTRDIAQELWVTEPTVKFHVRNIYAKLGLASRAQAAAYARREGLVAGECRDR
jgi:two-component system, NarL family, response regulator LiaR